MFSSVPAGYGGQAAFSALFYRILPSVPDPAAYLAETRIPPSYIALIGKHAFSPGIPISDPGEQRRFARWFGPSDLAALFLRHPNIAWRMLMLHLDEGSLDRVRMKTGDVAHRLGNYERSTGKPPQTLSHFFCFWPYIKERLFGGHPWRYLLYILGVVTAAWMLRPHVSGMRPLLAIVTTMLAVSLAVVMADGVESGRHLMIFNFLLDLLAAAVAAFAVERWRVGFSPRGASAPPKHWRQRRPPRRATLRPWQASQGSYGGTATATSSMPREEIG